NKLVEPERKEECESSCAMLVQNQSDNEGTIKASSGVVDDNLSDGDLKEPPGFSLSNNHQINNGHKEELQLPMSGEAHMEEHQEQPNHSKNLPEVDEVDLGVPPGFSSDVEHKEPCDGSDEDPALPPGFG